MANILIVDDDPAIRELIQDVLAENGGHTFDQASNGDEALKKIRAARFNLVILDRGMPKMDAMQVLRQLRSSPATANLKVLICTGSGMMSDVEEALSAGASDYIVKPLDFAMLNIKVGRLTRNG